MAVDTRKYERAIAEAGATEYEEAVVKRSLMIHRYFTTSNWGRMFPNGVFLDYGCGTGILGCGTSKLTMRNLHRRYENQSLFLSCIPYFSDVA